MVSFVRYALYVISLLYGKNTYNLMVKPRLDCRIDFRLDGNEAKLLDEYCNITNRTKTDVLRELIRGLKKKVEKLKDERVS